MDFMELEKERGITIASAATCCEWRNHEINIIDTPGHVDFTIEVERALRVLDGAILVLCSVGGVQSQSITVDQQMARYKVPCIAFVNKCDRNGANPFRVIDQLNNKLGHNAVAMQVPIGLEADFEGIVDLITMKAIYFDGENGEIIRTENIPQTVFDEAIRRREKLIDAASMFSDELTEAALEDRVTEDQLVSAIRKATLARRITPVFIGSAYKNKGVQPLLDAVARLLPCPADVENRAIDWHNPETPVLLSNEPGKPLVSFAFKLEEGRYGQLTYIRVYQGAISKGDTIVNVRTGKKVKVGRLVRMHADQMEDIDTIPAGYIGALFGIDCASGDTFVTPGLTLTMSPMHVPEPVISLAIVPKDKDAETNMSKALSRFTKEDPTLKPLSVRKPAIQLFPGWVNCILKSMLNECVESIMRMLVRACPAWHTGKQSHKDPNSITLTRSKPAARDNLVELRDIWNLPLKKISSLKTKCLAVPFQPSSSPRVKRGLRNVS